MHRFGTNSEGKSTWQPAVPGSRGNWSLKTVEVKVKEAILQKERRRGAHLSFIGR